MDSSSLKNRLPRRAVLRFFAAASAYAAVPVEGAETAARPVAKGYGTDPDFSKIYQPGEVWPLTLSAVQRAASDAFANVLLPADDYGPAASQLAVTNFIDEWVSAPYPNQQRDRPTVLEGLAWIDAEAHRRFGKAFPRLATKEQHAICDDICRGRDVTPEFKKPARFFELFRNLAMTAYYGTAEGWKAIGYIGNLTTATFDGPPQEVLDRLGLTQTVR